MRALSGSLLLSLVATLLPRVRAQDDLAALADAVVRALAPATDDPDAVAHDLVAQALAQARSPAASFLIEEVMRRVPSLQRPAALRDVPGLAAATGRHGLLELRLAELRWLLDRATAGNTPIAPGSGPFASYADEVLVAGPFGDAGDHYTGVIFPPELHFPALGAELAGRGTTATVRGVARKPEQRRLLLAPLARPLPGCYYAQQRIRAAAATAGYLEIECDGAFQVFVDGTEVLRVEPWLAPGPSRRYVPLQLPAGEHRALVKTCSNEQSSMALRWVDDDGAPLPGVTGFAADAAAADLGERASATGEPFVTALDAFAKGAAAPAATPALRIAALRCAVQHGAVDLALSLAEALREKPTAEPGQLLAWAQIVPSLALPDELRAAEARGLEEQATSVLPGSHHHARIAKARLLEQQDRREEALILLAGHQAPGPETFAFRSSLVRRLRFEGEDVPLLREWARTCPADPRPLVLLAAQVRSGADAHGALALLQQAITLRPDHTAALRQAFDLALDLGEVATARTCIDRLAPPRPGADSLERSKLERRLAARTGDRETTAALLAAIAAHPEADTATLEQVAELLARAGNADAAIACLRQCLALDADLPHVRAWLAEFGASATDGADFAAFRRDGDAARAAFQPGEREKTATSTVLIDQRIVELFADGSWLHEVHELRAINDLAGVDEFRTASAPANADEVLFVRTVDKEGNTYVPLKVENDYALQRLEPGVFVEWRYRERGAAPGPEPLRTDRFLFRSTDAPLVTSELVLILPANHRGELRQAGLGPPTQRRELSGGRTALVFVRNDVPRLPQERHLPPLGEIVPFAEVGEDQTPFAALRETRVQLLQRSRPTPPVLATAAKLFAALPDERSKVHAAWNFAQTAIESGPAESATQAILRKKGNRFLVVVALLRAAGIAVAPTACVEQRPDLDAGDDALFADGSDHRMPGAMVTLADGSVLHLFVDAPRHWPLGAVPAGRARSRAFVVRDDGVESVELQGSPDALQALRVQGKAVVEDGDVQITATARIGDAQGFALAERIRELKEDVRKLAARQIAQQMFPGWRVGNAHVVLDRQGEAFLLELQLSRTCVQQDGERWLVPLPMAPGKHLATYGDRAERTLPFWLGHEMHSEWDIVLEPGSDRSFAELPAPTCLDYRGFHHLLTFAAEGAGLRIRRTTTIEPTSLPAVQFGSWLQVLTAADRADQTSVQLRSRAK